MSGKKEKKERPFAVRNGWTLLRHPAFRGPFDELVAEVTQLQAADADGWTGHPKAKLLKRIRETRPLPAPATVEAEIPLDDAGSARIAKARREIASVMAGRDDRLVVVAGPCSIHDPAAAVEYAALLGEAAGRHEGELVVAMRVYFEKPRTVVGWKGLINDPYLDETFEILTWKQINLHDKPVILIDMDGYWSPWLTRRRHGPAPWSPATCWSPAWR